MYFVITYLQFYLILTLFSQVCPCWSSSFGAGQNSKHAEHLICLHRGWREDSRGGGRSFGSSDQKAEVHTLYLNSERPSTSRIRSPSPTHGYISRRIWPCVGQMFATACEKSTSLRSELEIPPSRL